MPIIRQGITDVDGASGDKGGDRVRGGAGDFAWLNCDDDNDGADPMVDGTVIGTLCAGGTGADIFTLARDDTDR